MQVGDSYKRLTITGLFGDDVRNGKDYIRCQCSCGKNVVLRTEEWGKTEECYVCHGRAYRYKTNPPKCRHCGKVLMPKQARDKYCSMRCRIADKGYKHDDCILYGTTKQSMFNYRKIFVGGSSVLMKDEVWKETHGEIPDGYQVMHTCNNPACVNIEHLELIPTKADEIEDHDYSPEVQKCHRREDSTYSFMREHFIDKTGRFLLHKALRYYGYSMSDLFIKKASLGLSNYRSSKGHVSANEAELFEWIPIDDKELSNRKLIAPYEVDILLSSDKLAIEYDGIIWHSNYFKNGSVGKTQYKDKLLRERGYTLLNIFEGENVDVWKSIILKHLHRDSPTTATITNVKPICREVYANFITNHGINTKSDEHSTFGVYNDNTMVAVFDASINNTNFTIERFVQDYSYHFDFFDVCKRIKEIGYDTVYWIAERRIGEQIWLSNDSSFRHIDTRQPEMVYYYSGSFYSEQQAIEKVMTHQKYDSGIGIEENFKRLKFFSLLDIGRDVFLYCGK